MEAILREINSLVGVRGSFVCDDDGTILSSVWESSALVKHLPEVAVILMKTLKGVISISGRGWVELDLVYKQDRIVVRKIEDGCLCIFSVREVNLPILYASADRAAERLGPDKGGPITNVGDQDLSTTIEQLKAIVTENLGSHAGKVLTMIDGASGSREDLEKVCDEIEEATRLFINKDKSKEMAESMRVLLQGEGTS